MTHELYEHSYLNSKHFSFGKNWKYFLKSLNPDRVRVAEQSLVDFLGGKDRIAGKTFIDIGCGSGLFSLAAYRLGAKKIVSVDIDHFSLECAHYLKKKSGNPEHWEVVSGSALDQGFLRSLGTFDIVYSWGVLHHTGDMYRALKNILPLVNQSGHLYIALYNDNQNLLEGTSRFWSVAKKAYNHSPRIGKFFMEWLYTGYYICGLLSHGKNPIRYIREYRTLRGMNFFTDIKDWLGGYPYEYASTEKIVSYFEQLGFRCIKTHPARSIGCNEFLLTENLTPISINNRASESSFRVQVDKSHYFQKYDNMYRFLSYYQQISSIITTQPSNVLEIGVGNKTVSNYLKQFGYNLTTCDFDKELGPDVVGDIRNLPFPDNSFDTVAACEILEHLPFSDFEKALQELRRVSRKNVVLSFPYSCAYTECILRISMPFFQKQFHWSIRIPYFFLKVSINERNKEHYWEMGTRGCSKHTLRTIIKKYFLISQEFHPPLNPYHYFFILINK